MCLLALVRLACVLLATAGDGSAPRGAATPPPWLEDRFVASTFPLTEGRGELDLDADGVAELAVATAADGLLWLELRAPGTLLAPRPLPGSSVAVPAFTRFAELGEPLWQALTFAAGADGRPAYGLTRCCAAAGDERVLRTVRLQDDGGGMVARLRLRTAPDVAVDAEVLVLAPDTAWLPGAAAARPPGAVRSGSFTLFADDVWHHPAWGGFDLVTLDCDRRSSSLARTRFTGLATEIDHGRTWPSQSPPRRPLARGEAFGFARWLDIEVLDRGPPRGVTRFRWHERKADEVAAELLQPATGDPFATAAPAISVRELVVLHPSGEPQAGAWCVVRDRDRHPALHPALFSVESTADGKVPLPVEARVDTPTADVIAFTAGASARFGRRRGTVAPVGESIVLLDEAATTTVRVTPPLRRHGWIGLSVASGAFLLELPADGVLRLPALGEEALLHVGSPWVAAIHRIELAPGREFSIVAQRLPAP